MSIYDMCPMSFSVTQILPISRHGERICFVLRGNGIHSKQQRSKFISGQQKTSVRPSNWRRSKEIFDKHAIRVSSLY
jgi:hypothetical protein